MSRLARLRSWLRAAFRRPDLNREIADELEFHIDRYAEDLERQGLSRAEAARRARAELGSLDGRREECRESLGLRLIDELRGDVRYTLRLLRRSPAFTAVAVLSLGLGIGANTAIFSLVDAVLLKSLSVSQPERLFFVDNSGGKSEGGNAPPYPCYEILRDGNRHFSGLAMFEEERLRVTIDGSEERLRAQYASGNYFDVLGVRAVYGRTLTAADDVRGGNGGPDGPVVVISHGFWKQRFGMSPSVLGQRIRIGTKAMTIVGVTPPEFFGLTVGSPIDLTVPVTLSDHNLSQRQSWWFSVVGRLASGAGVEPARAELDGMFQTYMAETMGRAPRPTDYFNRIELVPAARGLHHIRNQFSTPLAIVMAIVGLVLVIGCANVANLLLARASARQGEMSLRLAIGAGRARLVRQLLTEGLVLSALGALAGLLLAYWGAHLLAGMIGATRQQIVLAPQFDARVLGFTTGVAVLTGLFCSVLPAFSTTRLARANAGGTVRTSPSRSRRRIGQGLVVVQVTLSLTLLAGAALFIRTLRNLEHLDAGFRAEGVLGMPVEAVIAKQPPAGADPQMAKAAVGRMWEDLADRVGRLPGVQSAAASTLVPMSGPDRGVTIEVVGGPPLAAEDRYVRLNQISAGYFETLGVRLRAGRLFNSADGTSSVAILGETAARAYFGAASPVGRIVSFGPRSDPYEVIGVVEDTQYENLREEPMRLVYLPMHRPLDAISRVILVVRTKGDTGTLVPAMREEVRRSVPGGFAAAASTLEQQVEGSLLQERLVSMLASAFGALALALACVGLYGLLSYGVVRRTREFGIRMAIGARRGAVIWLVLRETLGLIAAALVCGMLVVLGLGRYVQTVLYDVSPRDPLAIGAALALLLAIALTAAYLPARRASRINPTSALRQE